MLRSFVFAATFACAPLALAQSSPHESDYLRNVRQLTRDFQKAGEAYFGPDAQQIVFQAIDDEHPYYQIWVMDADGANQRMISTGLGKTTCAFIDPANPGRFQYASSHLDPASHAPPPPEAENDRSYTWDYDDAFDVFVADLATGEILHRLTDAHGYDAEGSYSHDGATICFTSRRDGDDDIWLMDADGSNERVLVRVDGKDGGPFFLPGDQWVLYRATRGAGHSMHVFMTRVDGSGETRQLTTVERVNWAPFPHPSGDVVVYAANNGGHRNFDLFLVKTDGSGREVQLTVDGEFDGLPTFSPDGTQLLWTSTRVDGRSQVFCADFVMPADDAFQVPAPPADPHGHGSDPHGHGSDPHSRPANPHGGDPHSRPANPHGGDPHSQPANPHSQPANVVHQGAQATLPGVDRIQGAEIFKDVEWLSDDRREGRAPGTGGGLAAARYIALRLEEEGASPGAADGRWFQPFSFNKGARIADTGNDLTVQGHALGEGQWWSLRYSSSATVDAELVFAGYGITAMDHHWDDLEQVDLDGKIAVVLTGGPQSDEGGAFHRSQPTVFEDLRYKVANCRDHGAAAVLLVRAAGEGELLLGDGDPGIPVAQLSRAAAAAQLGLDLDRLTAHMDESGQTAAQPIGVHATLRTNLERVPVETQNVVGRITGSLYPDQVIVVGAHYDHLGWGGSGSRAPGVHAIHNGADDNASGTAALFALAAALRDNPPQRTVVFVAFGAEESGLVGSKYFLEHCPIRTERIVTMINMDMIGRVDGDPLVVGGVGTAHEFPGLIQHAADVAQLPVATQTDGQGPSDHANFYNAGIPVFFLFSGTHSEYHTPQDDAHLIDVDGLGRTARLAYALLRGIDDLVDRPQFIKVQAPDQPRRVVTGERGAYFGSIPDYVEEGIEGVLLSGARPGTPADDAGIVAGDIVVSFAGHAIRNIYDYTNALRLCRPGQEVEVVVLRDGERVTLEVTLGSR